MSTFRRGNIRLAVASLRSAKARSVLTMLGVIIAVVAVLCVVSITEGVKRQIIGQVQALGDRVLTIVPASNRHAPVIGIGSNAPGQATTLLTEGDLQAIQSTPGVEAVAPLAVATGSAQGDHEVADPLVIATGADLPKILNRQVAQGGFFDADTNNRTVVLGQRIAAQLFDDTVPLGQTLTYRGQQFIVTGIFGGFAETPFSLSQDFNDAIFLPYSTAQTLNGGALGMYQILAMAASGQQVPKVAALVNDHLTAVHGGTRQAVVLDPTHAADRSNSNLQLLTVLTVAVAAIALVVGGVGIMNVMLVSVTERMHEIGIRKAIGATNRQILRQFVTEACVLSVAGAAIGVVISLAVVGLLHLYSTLEPVIVWPALVLVPLAAVGVGVLFGVFPALKAARKDPIEALRHE